MNTRIKRSCLTIVVLSSLCSCIIFAVIRTPVSPENAQSSLYRGIPESDGMFMFLPSTAYIVDYDEESCNPAWVAYYIPPQSGPSKIAKRRPQFKIDVRTDARVSNRDYAKTGYDRGHMAPNFVIAARYGLKAQIETFLLSNICPQTPKLNRGIWKKLESLAANKYARTRGVWVVTGPLYGNKPAMMGRIRKPAAFFKILVALNDTNQPEALAFIIPQDECKANLENYLVNIDTIEALSGCDFFSDLPDDVENRLESQKAAKLWD